MRKIRLLILLSLSFLVFMVNKYPIFTPMYFEDHEGEKIPLYFVKVLDKEGEVYYVDFGFTHEKVKVVSEGNFAPGDVVSFYGTIIEGALINQNYRLHPYPNSTYYLSTIGLVLFLALFLRKWRFSLKEMRFKEV